MLARLLPYVPRPLVWRVARRYITGLFLYDAIAAVRSLNKNGVCATISSLGEQVSTEARCNEAHREYMEILDILHKEGLQANISVKPTNLGLKLNEAAFRKRINDLVSYAGTLSNFVRLDMEDSTCTEGTLASYEWLKERHRNVGPVIQARLRRSLKDAERLASLRANTRLCLGIYLESPTVAFQDRREIHHNFLSILEVLLAAGCYIGIATHNERLLRESQRLLTVYQLPPDYYEFQMLLGVREDLRMRLLKKGHCVRVYVPFGKDWYAYSLRRLRENPKLAWTVARALMTGR